MDREWTIRQALLVLALHALLPFASISAFADQSVVQIYSAPFYDNDAYYNDGASDTIGDQVLNDWNHYQPHWGVSPYGSLHCGYLFKVSGNGPVTGYFGGLSWTGQCGGGDGIYGTATCPAGYTLNGNVCTPDNTPIPQKNRGQRCQPCDGGGGPTQNGSDPVNAANGNVYEVETDEAGSGPFPLRLERYYNSNSAELGSFGTGWSSYYERRLLLSAAVSDGSTPFRTLYAYRPNGRVETFNTISTSAPYTFSNDADVTDWVESSSNGYVLHAGNGIDEGYDTTGRLIRLQSHGGHRQTLSYNSAGQLQTVTDALGHQLTFAYHNQGTVASATDSAGNVYSYQYDDAFNLTGVVKPPPAVGGQPVTRQYVYENAGFPHALTGIIDENGNRHATWRYDSSGRAISSQQANGVRIYTFAYFGNTTLITDPLGTQRRFTFQTLHGVQKMTTVSGGACDLCDAAAQTQYDANGFVSSRTDYDGNLTTYQFNSLGLETSRTEASGTAQARTITTTWNPDFRLPDEIDETGRKTTLSYDNLGRLLSKTITDTDTGTSRRWTYTYNSLGQVLTTDGPRTDVTDVTTYAYYPIASGDPTSGELRSVTDALGHVTTIDSYDADGHPLSNTDPNGLVKTLTWTPRGKLASLQRGTEITRYEYDAVGELTGISLPTGAALSLTYDAAHRLTRIQDQLGNQVVYTLDAMGNRTQIDSYDPGGTLTHTRQQVYNRLNRLQSVIGAQGQTTSHTYDPQGNLTSRTDPLNHSTDYGYDALGRLVEQTDADQQVTRIEYDALDQVIQVTDPNGLVTRYTPNALGEILRLDSPDSGITTYQYDAAGNVVQRTDAAGEVVHFQYDALNRLTRIDYADNRLDVIYRYDENGAGQNGIGRLTTRIDAAGTHHYAYDPYGNLIRHTRTLDGVSTTLAYQYDGAGRLTRITYPSGRQVDYHYDPAGQIDRVSATFNGVTQLIADSLRYLPFGPLQSLIYGNGLPLDLSYDLDYRLTGNLQGSVLDQGYGYDPADNLTLLNDRLDPNRTTTYTYDPLDRLTGAGRGTDSRVYAYDSNGNRLTGTHNGLTQDLQYALGSNRLEQITGAIPMTFQYDANGQLIADGVHTFTYTASHRLSAVHSGNGLLASYTYDGQGRRSGKTVAGIEIRYHYAPGGQLLAETDAQGHWLREYAYLDGEPLAMWVPDPASAVTLTRSTGSAVVPEGTVVTLTAVASGGSGSYEYRYWLKGPATGSQYTLLQDYAPSGTYLFDTTGRLGKNVIKIEARNQRAAPTPPSASGKPSRSIPRGRPLP